MATEVAASLPALMIVANAVAGQPTWTERLPGSNAATSGTVPVDAADTAPGERPAARLGNTAVGPQPVVTARYSGPLRPLCGPMMVRSGATFPFAVRA